MSTITMNDIRKLEVPTTFLSLGPVTSSGYPQSPKSPTTEPMKKPRPARRTSSMDSDKPTYRILKLGPVHHGEHPDEHKEDWHEVAVE